MSLELDSDLRDVGTRFRLFPQPPVLDAFRVPERVWVSPPAGSIGPGPADARMYVVEPIEDKLPYGFPYLPPYRGPRLPPVMPDDDGHFDHLLPGSLEFQAAHMYGTLRRLLDIWEDYFGSKIDWHFRSRYPRLELIPRLLWDNAQSGFGFIETGYGTSDDGKVQPYCLNFDVLAHEFGHGIIFSRVGTPRGPALTAEYLGFQESASDLVALVSVLHFESFLDHVLSRSSGNLYALNELNRIGELSETDQIRIASNAKRMSDVVDVATLPEALTQHELHELGEPLTGAIFDILVEVFEDRLLELGLISRALDRMSRQALDEVSRDADVQSLFDAAYRSNSDQFKRALIDARDYVGACLARTWNDLSAEYLSFSRVARAFLAADRVISGGRYRAVIVESFEWREIDLGSAGEFDTGRRRRATAATRISRARTLTSPSYRERLAGIAE